MTILALATTIVSGTVTLQGNTYTFTGSGSGTATAYRVLEAKKLAVAASNAAAISVARDSINKILTENSAVLTDLEITNLISNNLSTTVVAFKPISLESIASSTDGVNYTLNEQVTIEEDQMLTIPAGKTLIGLAGNPFTNNGYIQIYGNFYCGAPGSKALKTDITTDYTNNGNYKVNSGATLTIDSGVTFTNSGSTSGITNSGGSITNAGTITCSGQNSFIRLDGSYDYVSMLYNKTVINFTGSSSYFRINSASAVQGNGAINLTGNYIDPMLRYELSNCEGNCELCASVPP
jgi:hypothetical protein